MKSFLAEVISQKYHLEMLPEAITFDFPPENQS